ncbi:MAG: LysR family transcriptional regulator [Oscillospiraceae bacterium]|nr:LysR family transcriptional regulator [Oscillospiraceae bacterium]
MTITQVQYACEIARRGSMTRAAEQFYISQPALSEQIKALEIELGCTLFRRTARGTALTEAGERFCKYAEPAIRAWKELEQNCADLKNGHYSRVHIGFGVRARSNGLFEPIMSFFDSHPEISVSFITDMNESFPEAIEAGRMDIAIGRLY